ncbi:hypothetical protein ACFQ07_11250, partial [Actinomadura adrarensis]
TAALVSVPTAANAEPFLTVNYPFTGTSHINATNSDLELGPGVLNSTLDLATGAVTANMQLPPAPGSFDAFGFIPVTVTTTMTEAGPTTGQVDLTSGAVSTTSNVVLQLSDLKIVGIPFPVGSDCKSETPATINLNSEADWSILLGGTLSGTYTITDFRNCGLPTFLINLLVPGPDNTLSLKLGAAEVVPPATADQLAARIG